MTTFEPSWLGPPSGLALLSNEIHVWRVMLNQPAERVQQFAQTLSDDERQRAARFYFERDRNHYIVGRGVLRAILGRYLKVEPDKLNFSYGPRGKPHLVPRYSGTALQFNLSHSHVLGLYAFIRSREIGVDVEHVRPLSDLEQIAARFFSASENAALQALPVEQKQEAFFNCWTRKEAYIKAIGDGLAQPLDRFDVSLTPGKPARLLSIDGDPQKAAQWSLMALMPTPGYVAALAVRGHGWQLACWEYL